MIRLFDIFFSLLGLLIFSPILLVLMVIGFFDTGSPFFQQERVGVNQKPFKLYKFRSMRINTQSVATHMVHATAVTRWGSVLRRTKLDEFPQLLNVLFGDMSLVGPRPCLFNQFELIEERSNRSIFSVRPGITGLAQIKKVDMSTPSTLASIEADMISNLSLLYYFKYIFLTVFGKGYGDRILR
jgi:lipopolysaccharide/colanic/teichoic acid biosynthesis glycosyltransferase